jgi:hypothetical protein
VGIKKAQAVKHKVVGNYIEKTGKGYRHKEVNNKKFPAKKL